VKTSIRRRLAAGKQRVEKRLDKANCEGCERPMLRPANIQYELAERTRGMTYGGIGSMLCGVQDYVESADRSRVFRGFSWPCDAHNHRPFKNCTTPLVAGRGLL
jgi:hypothetical protein